MFAISSLVFLFLISLTGLILNHADALGLSRASAGPAILRLYGVELPPVDAAFEADGIVYASSSGLVFANGNELAQAPGKLVGAVAVEGGVVLATGSELLVTTRAGHLVERFSPELEGRIARLGSSAGQAVLAVNNRSFLLDAERMAVAELAAPQDLDWSMPVELDSEQAAQIGQAALGNAISWERVLVDLHSGRILPTVGTWIADITALCLIYLCISGAVLWFRRR